jgi:hypothetical protein
MDSGLALMDSLCMGAPIAMTHDHFERQQLVGAPSDPDEVAAMVIETRQINYCAAAPVSC